MLYDVLQAVVGLEPTDCANPTSRKLLLHESHQLCTAVGQHDTVVDTTSGAVVLVVPGTSQ